MMLMEHFWPRNLSSSMGKESNTVGKSAESKTASNFTICTLVLVITGAQCHLN